MIEKFNHPRNNDIHTIADFAEILCLITQDRSCSRDYLCDYIRDVADKTLSLNDLDDTFLQLSWREKAYGDFYPFSLDEHVNVLSGYENISENNRLYIFTLLCSNLPFLPRASRNNFTDAFERASKCVFQKLWPQHANIRLFGKNETEYTGEKWERLNKLGIDIGGQPNLTKEVYRARDSGDGGIDLVGWLDLDAHEITNKPAALAQCACSREDWVSKQSEIANHRLSRQLRPTTPWMELIFIPHSFRDNRGLWAQQGDLSNCIIVDRLRMLKNINTNLDLPEISPPDELQEFLDYRLDLV